MKVKSFFLVLYLAMVATGTVTATANNSLRSNTVAERHTPGPVDYKTVDAAGAFGGRIVSCFLNDPRSFHPLVTDDLESQVRNQLMNPGLIRINLLNQTPEPELAKSWEISPDQLRWTFHLRKGLKWSDGAPFGGSDVLFTMQVVNDPNFPNTAKDALTVGTKPIRWQMLDEYTIVAELPSVFAPFLRKLDSTTLPIIAKHKWEKYFKAGRLIESLSINMNPTDSVTLGPFVLKEYKPGEYLRLARNTNYWKLDRQGYRLPYLDEIVFLILTDLNHLQLKIESGEIDTFYSVRAQDIGSTESKASATGMKLYRLGPSYGYEGLFFNQNGGSNPKTDKAYLDPVKRSWFTDINFRKAVSYSIDRDAIVRNTLFGMGQASYGPESVSNVSWYNDRIIKYPTDPTKAKELLQLSGFYQKTSVEGKRILYDEKGNPVRFSLYTNAGNTVRNQECLMIAMDLAKLGMQVDYSPIDFQALVSKITSSYDYDAILLGKSHEVEPADGMSAWLSSSSGHFWCPNQQVPQTTWERRIDDLIHLQVGTFDHKERKKYYDEVQYILSDQVPMVFTVNESVVVCAKEKIGNLKPTISRHRTLWNAEELYWKK